MAVPCVRVEREAGEETRQRLAESDLVDGTHRITHDEGHLYIPVTEPAAVPEEYDVVEYDAPERPTQTTPDDLVDFTASYERLGEVAIIDEDDPVTSSLQLFGDGDTKSSATEHVVCRLGGVRRRATAGG